MHVPWVDHSCYFSHNEVPFRISGKTTHLPEGLVIARDIFPKLDSAVSSSVAPPPDVGTHRLHEAEGRSRALGRKQLFAGIQLLAAKRSKP
jgi:hypothetical protein